MGLMPQRLGRGARDHDGGEQATPALGLRGGWYPMAGPPVEMGCRRGALTMRRQQVVRRPSHVWRIPVRLLLPKNAFRGAGEREEVGIAGEAGGNLGTGRPVQGLARRVPSEHYKLAGGGG